MVGGGCGACGVWCVVGGVREVEVGGRWQVVGGSPSAYLEVREAGRDVHGADGLEELFQGEG